MLTGERNRGFTLVEMMVAVVLVVLIFGVAASVVKTGQDSLGGSSLQGEMHDRVRILLNRLQEELMSSGPSCPGWNTAPMDPVKIQYRKCMGYDYENAEVLWDPPIAEAVKEIRLEDDPHGDPADNWKQIVVSTAGVDEVIQRGLEISDLTFEVDPDNARVLRITVELAKKDARVQDLDGQPKDRRIKRSQTMFLRN